MPWRLTALSFVAVVAGVCPAAAADFEKYLPPDTAGIVTVDATRIVASKPFDKHLRKPAEALVGSEMVAPLVKLAGIDPLKDVTRLTFAFAPSLMRQEVLPGGEPTARDGLHVVVTGRFDAKKIHALVEKLAADGVGIEGHKIGDRLLYEVGPNLGQGYRLFAVVASPSALVLSTNPTFAEDALNIAARQDSGAPKEVQPLVAALDDKSSVAWSFSSQMISRQSVTTVEIPGQPPALRVKLHTMGEDGTASFVGGLTTGDKLTLSTRFCFANRESMKKQVEFLERRREVFTRMFDGMAEEEKGLVPVVEAIKGVKLNPKGNDLTVSGELDGDAVGVLLKLLTRR